MAQILTDQTRAQHVYTIGKTGYGKTTFFWNMAAQDIALRKGVAIIDPVGTLVKRVLTTVPKQRIDDVVYFGIDSLVPLWNWKTVREEEVHSVANDMVAIFSRITEGWGPRMDTIITECTHAVVHHPTLTFMDLYDFLTDDIFRQQCVEKLPDDRRDFWEKVFPEKYRGAQITQPIITRLRTLYNSKPLRTLFSARESRITIPEIIESGKVLLVDLSRFDLSDVKALGMIIISQFEFAMRRRAWADDPEELRQFFLYVDEFQDFVFTPLDKFFDRARNFRVSLTVSHHRLGQLDGNMTSAALATGSLFFFSVLAEDAQRFRLYIEPYDPGELVRLPEYHVIYNVKGKVAKTKLVNKPRATFASHAEEIKTRTRELYIPPIHNKRYEPSKPQDDAPVPPTKPKKKNHPGSGKNDRKRS